MSRVPRQAKSNPEPSYPAWKAAAVNACLKVHEQAAGRTRDSIWTHAYIMQLSPAEAAEIAAREYDSTHPAVWIKRRRP
jgi:hypothetical protein